MQSRFRDWGDVRLFLAVMREGSTLAAARHLGVNQTTVSRRIDVLEHALGVTLFARSTRGARPTEQATALLPYAQTLEQAAIDFEAQAEATKASDNAPIRITAFESGINGNIAAVVAEFSEKHPGVSFEFNFAERSLDLMKGEADVALRMTPSAPDEKLIAQKVGQSNWTYYSSRSYAAKNNLPSEYGPDMEDHAVHLLNHVKSDRQNLVRCATSHNVVMALQTGQGIGPLPLIVGDANPELVRCFEPPPGSELQVWLVTSPAAHKRADVRRFTAFAAPRIARNLKQAR